MTATKSPFHDDIAQEVVRQFKISEEYTKPYFDRFLDNYEHYFIRTIDKAVEDDSLAYPFYSQLMIPVSFQTVETIMPRMFSRLPSFRVQTEEENDDRDERALENLLRYQMNHPYLVDDPMLSRFASTAKEMFITGNAWAMVPWMLKEVEVEEWQPIIPDLGVMEPSWENIERARYYEVPVQWQLVKVKKKVIDAPVMQHKSIFSVFPDPKKKWVSQLGYIVIRDMMTMDEVMDLVNISPEKYQNIDELKKMKAMKNFGSGREYDEYAEDFAGIFGSKDWSTKDDTEGQYEVFTRIKQDRMDIVVNRSLTIRSGANPNGDGKLGIALMKDIPIPNELFAWGEVDPIKRMEDAMSDMSNMRVDSVFNDLLRMYMVDYNALTDSDEFIPEPGVVVGVNRSDAITPIETGSTSASAYKEYEEWGKIIQNVSGVTEYATGQAGEGQNPTARGVELLQQAANARFFFKLRLFEEMGLKAIGTMYINRNMRFFDEDQKIAVDGKKMTVYVDQVRRIRGNVHFIVDTGSTEAVDTNAEFSKWMQVLKLVSENKAPFNNLSKEALDYVAEKVLFTLRVPDPGKILQRDATSAMGNGTGQMPADLAQAMATGKLPMPESEQIQGQGQGAGGQASPSPELNGAAQTQVPVQNIANATNTNGQGSPAYGQIAPAA